MACWCFQAGAHTRCTDCIRSMSRCRRLVLVLIISQAYSLGRAAERAKFERRSCELSKYWASVSAKTQAT